VMILEIKGVELTKWVKSIKMGDLNHRVWNAILEPIEKLFRNMDKRIGVQEALAGLDGRLEASAHEDLEHASDIGRGRDSHGD
jgi:hypothetical protein